MGTPESSRPFVATPTASAPINNGSSGVIQFNVTADVRAFLAGTPNRGWLLKKADENEEGQVSFGSKESATKPQLLLGIVQSDTSRPVLPNGWLVPRDSAGLGVLAVPGSSETRLFRDIIGIRFDDSTSGPTVRAVLQKYSAQIIGGVRMGKQYIVRVPARATFASLMQLLDSVNAEPGVLNAASMAWSDDVRINGRFPDDGAGAARSDWFATTLNGYAGSRWAVRAPMAWGCETGEYGVGKVRMGIIDYFFSSAHPDLTGNLRRIEPPDSFLTVRNPPADTGIVHHGTAIAGVIAARGDNQIGVAGMIWKADVFGFLLTGLSAPGATRTTFGDVSQFFRDHVLRMAVDSSIRVLTASLNLKMLASDTSGLKDIEDGFREYIRSGGLVVLAAGNSNSTNLSRAQLASLPAATSPSGTFPALLVIAARIAGSADSGGVLVVSATDATYRQRQAESNYFPGLSVLAGPGENVLTLINDSMGVGSTGSYGHTSIAAPFVAGSAAMLWQSDSTLSPTQVRDYLIRGSQAPRVSPQTGQESAPPVIAQMAGVRLVDPFGALSLLSRERPGSPLCGAHVFVDSTGSGLTAEWGTTSRPIPVPLVGNEAASHVSVAQGGRRLAVHTEVNNTERSLVLNQAGQQIHVVSNARRVYLERDTADLAFDLSLKYPLLTLRGPTHPNGLGPLNLFNTFVSPQNIGGRGRIDVAPTADYVLIRYGILTTCDPGPPLKQFEDEIARLIELANLTPTVVTSARFQDQCSPGAAIFLTNSLWSNDARRVVVGRAISSLSSAPPSTGWALAGPSIAPVPPVNVGGILAWSASFTADDSLLVSYEENASNPCVRQYRNAAAPQTAVGSPTVISQDHCQEDPAVIQVAIPDAPSAVTSPGTRSRFDLFYATPRRRRHTP